MENRAEGRALSDEETLRKIIIASELERVIVIEEISWRQKSKPLWSKEGDECTKFSHKRNNAIELIEVDGVILSDHFEIKDNMYLL